MTAPAPVGRTASYPLNLFLKVGENLRGIARVSLCPFSLSALPWNIL
jgi:hypothetical protein